MSAKQPLLLLSSGARPRYLEDIVRVLALPEGGRIQFRYQLDLVANGVKARLAAEGLAEHTCYLAYLDNRTPGKKPDIVPVREAVILEAKGRGSSLILSMRVSRYVRTNELGVITAHIERNTQDKLPEWRPDHDKHPENPFEGYWVNFLSSGLSDTQLVSHDPEGGKHLGLFEASVNSLCAHDKDFGEPSRRLFFNIIGLKDSTGKVMPLVDGGWRLAPGRQYRFDLYHYIPEESPFSKRPTCWITCNASGPAVSVLGISTLRADSSYDSHVVMLETTGLLRKTQNALTIARTTDPKDGAQSTAELPFNVEVRREVARNIRQALIIGCGVAAPTLIASYDKLSAVEVVVVVGSSLVAGLASAFKSASSA
jgi:hypothetical protein